MEACHVPPFPLVLFAEILETIGGLRFLYAFVGRFYISIDA